MGEKPTIDQANEALEDAVVRLEALADELDQCTEPVARAKLLVRVNAAIDECNRADASFWESYGQRRRRWDAIWARAAEAMPALKEAFERHLGPLLRIMSVVAPLEADDPARRPPTDEELAIAEREAQGDPDLIALVRSIREGT